MTVADLQDKSLATLEIKPHPTIAEWDAKAEHIETPLTKGRIVWRKWGSGPPLVFFHGGSGSWTHWIRNIPVLSRDYTVYAVDLPGMGDSDPFTGKDLDLLPGETSDFRDPLDPAWQPQPIEMAALSRTLAAALETMIPAEKINLVGLLVRRHDGCERHGPHSAQGPTPGLVGRRGRRTARPEDETACDLAVRDNRGGARQGAASECRHPDAARPGVGRRPGGEHPDAQRHAHAVAQAAPALHDIGRARKGEAEARRNLGAVSIPSPAGKSTTSARGS